MMEKHQNFACAKNVLKTTDIYDIKASLLNSYDNKSGVCTPLLFLYMPCII